MSDPPEYEIIFNDDVQAHFSAIQREDFALIFDTIERQLALEPNHKTRNRKALRIPDFVNATWELRCGLGNRYRVFYDVDVDDRLVIVLAIGMKLGSKLMIGNEEIEL